MPMAPTLPSFVSAAGPGLELLRMALSTVDAQTAADADGFLPITKLLRLRPELKRETWSSIAGVVKAAEAEASGLRLDKAKRRIRLLSLDELICDEAERELAAAPATAGGVPVRKLVSLPSLRESLASIEDPEGFVRSALERSQVVMVENGFAVYRRPRGMQLRSLVEELFSDEHLARDQRLRSKIAESNDSSIPLSWLLSRYSDQLGVPAGCETDSVLQELCQALESSQVLYVDHRRLVAQRIVQYRTEPQDACVDAGGLDTGKGKSVGRATQNLKSLLDFYFEPFTLQHNRYLLDLVASKVGEPLEKGPWVQEALVNFSFKLEDLTGLGRIAGSLQKLKFAQKDLNDFGDSEELKHLFRDADGQLKLKTLPEVRSFVPARDIPEEVTKQVRRYLSAAREQRVQAPATTVSVLSYAVAEALFDATQRGEQRRARLKRQLLVHHTDLVCLQGLSADPKLKARFEALQGLEMNTTNSREESLLEALRKEGYLHHFAQCRTTGEANAIFWDSSRWELVEQLAYGSAAAVVLRPFEDLQLHLRVVCFQPRLPKRLDEGLRRLFGSCVPTERGPPVLVCADLSELGGAEGACIVEEIAGLPSVAQEVLNGELASPYADVTPQGEFRLAKSAASGLNKLRRPDAVLFGGVSPSAALSGHTEGYLATIGCQEALQQFPALRIPIVAAFDWKGPPPEDLGIARPKTVHRI